jgi:Mrp family chromosome partitioning ATPase
MSRNFELLQRLGFEEQVTVAAPPERVRRPAIERDRVRRTEPLPSDPHAARIVERLYLAAEGTAPQSLLFVSLESRSGDTLCGRVAESLAAQVSGRVCVVDTNFGRPSLHSHFRVPNDRGLAGAVTSDDPIESFGHRIAGTDLTVVPAGGRWEVSASERLADRIRELREHFDYVLVQSAVGSDAADACFLGRLLGSAVLVIEAHKTRRDTAARIKSQLQQNGVSVLGAVLNNRTFPVPQSLYSKLF